MSGVIQAGTAEHYGAHSERGEVEAWGGIVSARLEAHADALDAAPQAILDAVEREGIESLVDTADPKGRGDDGDRPTEPALRCLAFTEEDYARLAEALDGSD